MRGHKKITEVLLKARACGYKCQDFAKIKIDYNLTIKECLIFKGTHYAVPEFTKFEIENLEDFTREFFNHKDVGHTWKLSECRDMVISHFKELVSKYIMTGDTLKAGAGMLGAHQMVYVENSDAWREHLRLEQWQKDRSEKFRKERVVQ